MNSIFTTPKVFVKDPMIEKYHYYPSPAIPQSSPVPEINPSSPHFEVITPKVNLNDKWKCRIKAVDAPQEDTMKNAPKSHKENKPSDNAASCQTSFIVDKALSSNCLFPGNNRNNQFVADLEPCRDNIPKPIMKDEIAELLSNSCDTSQNSATLSPVALKWYLDRFKNAAPTHSSKRTCTVPPPIQSVQTTRSSNGITTIEKNTADLTNLIDQTSTTDPTNFSDLSNFSSVDTSASSFFNLRISDNTTSSDDTSPDLTVSSREEIIPLHPSDRIPDKPISYSLQFEQIFGKNFDEMLELVPPEIVNPSSDENDILFQWRLKRAMDEAKSAPVLVNDVPDYALYSEINARKFDQNTQINHTDRVKISEPVQKVLREVDVQTDKELVTISCQVESDLVKQCPVTHNQTHPENNIPTIMVQPEKEVPELMTETWQKIDEEEEEGDFDSLSSYSDDLTVVSDLDDLNETVVAHSKDLVPQPADICSDNQHTNSLPLNQHKSQQSEEISRPGITISNTTPVTVEPIDDQSDKLLREYLQNILDSFDDPILTSFIDRYDAVQERMRIVEQLIEESPDNL